MNQKRPQNFIVGDKGHPLLAYVPVCGSRLMNVFGDKQKLQKKNTK